jgi:8-oxo-dGTP pyrophosphatase MutT (NUDIX family)
MRQHGPWQIHSTREVHSDPWVAVRVDDVTRPDGEPGTFTVVRVKPGVAVLAVDDEGNAYLTSEFRYALGRESVEAVAGGVEEGEEPLAAARRELKEELGIEATDWTDLGVLHTLTSIVETRVQLFLARGLSFGSPKQEGTETIRLMKLPLIDAVAAVLDGTISNGTTGLLILKAVQQK